MRKKVKSEADKLAMMASAQTGKRTALKIFYPTLTLFATAIPDRFYKALTLRALENGLLARSVSSGTYGFWRDLIVRVRFDHTLGEWETVAEEVERNLSLLWVDQSTYA